MEDGKLGPGGALPTNTNGGGLSYTHPGQYGMFLLVEAVRQLRGDRPANARCRTPRSRSRTGAAACCRPPAPSCSARRRRCDRPPRTAGVRRGGPVLGRDARAALRAAVVHRRASARSGTRARVCPRCLGDAIEWRDDGGDGTVYAASVPLEARARPRRRRRAVRGGAGRSRRGGAHDEQRGRMSARRRARWGCAWRWRGNRCPTAGTCRCSGPTWADRCRSPTSRRPCPSSCGTRAARFGDRTYLVADGERLTYRDVDARSAALAKGLLAEGIGKGSRVGILIPNSVDFVVAALGVRARRRGVRAGEHVLADARAGLAAAPRRRHARSSRTRAS